MYKLKHRLAVLLIMIMTLGFVFADEASSLAAEEGITSLYKAQVVKVNQAAVAPDGFIEAIYLVDVEVKTGQLKGQVITIEQVITSTEPFPMILEPGNRVIVGHTLYPEGYEEYFVSDYQRDTMIYWLIGLFILVILWVGRWQGVKTVVTLGLTLAAIAYIHIPLLLKGYSPILITILIAAVVTTLTIIIVSGFSKKSFAAIIGTLAGVVIAGVISLVIGKQAHLTGFSMEEAVMLKFIPQGDIFVASELLLSGILLGALGAVMDVAMSISSSIEELHHVSGVKDWRKLYKSGMNIGRDVMGTMTNTLILAYVGSALPMILLFVANDMPMLRVMNFDVIATEFVRSIAGSVGIVLCIPITALVAVMFIHRSTTDLKQE